MEAIQQSASGGKLDIVIAIFLSLLMHGVMLLVLFFPFGEIRGNMGAITAAERLSHAEEYIFKDLQGLVNTYHSQAKQFAANLPREEKDAWTLQNMPKNVAKALKAAGLKVSEVKAWPSANEPPETDSPEKTAPEKRYTIGVKLGSAGQRAFNDILVVSHAVGYATLKSDFWTDNLEITVTEKDATDKAQFIVPTMDCRLLYRNKLSPQEFLMGASVRRGISS